MKADDLLLQIYKEICTTGDISVKTTVGLAKYVMNQRTIEVSTLKKITRGRS